ncbi:major tail protein [Bacillus glycinifermentans]|uniref:major tail protein n=1 Tax=Bacillus glycinifermentans TaxID=1664069 RepID=UPI003D20DD9B
MGSVNVGLENLVYAKLIKDEKGNIQYGPVQHFAPAISANVDTSNENSTLYADNGPIIVNSNTGETKVKIGTSEIPQAVLAEITGQKMVKGVIAWRQDAVPPYVALGFTGTKEDGNVRHVWLTKGRFGIPGTDWKTKEDKTDFQTEEIEGTFVQRSDKVFKITGDSSVEGYEEYRDTFFDEVFDVSKLDSSSTVTASTSTTTTTKTSTSGGAA